LRNEQIGLDDQVNPRHRKEPIAMRIVKLDFLFCVGNILLG